MPEHVSSLGEFQGIIKGSGNRLVVVDFHAAWCGPCHAIAPFYESLSKKYERVARFLKVDVDEAQDIAQHCSVSAMPTFHMYLRGSCVSQFSGADKDRLEADIERHAPASADISFASEGQRLGGPTSGPSTVNWDAATAQDPAAARRAAAAEAAAKRVEARLNATKAMESSSSANDTEKKEETGAPPAEAPTESGAAEGASSEGLARHDPRLQVNQLFVKQLEELGFPKLRAEKALILTGNKAVETAMEWCFDHAEDPDIDEPLSIVTESGEVKARLTEEERKQKADEYIQKARAKRLEQEKVEEKQREKNRIKSGKDVTLAKRAYEEKERQRAIDQKRKEKLEQIAQKKRVKELLEADKRRRREMFHMKGREGSSSEPIALSAVQKPETSANAASIAKEPSGGKIQCRMPDGTRVESNFEPDQLLADVIAFVAQSHPGFDISRLKVSQQYPRRAFTENDYGTSLGELGLLPRGALNISF